MGDYSDVQLCSAANIGAGIAYVALNHCWGKILIKTLKIDSQKEFEAAILFKSLSRTFKDSISATRKLRPKFNVRYI